MGFRSREFRFNVKQLHERSWRSSTQALILTPSPSLEQMTWKWLLFQDGVWLSLSKRSIVDIDSYVRMHPEVCSKATWSFWNARALRHQRWLNEKIWHQGFTIEPAKCTSSRSTTWVLSHLRQIKWLFWHNRRNSRYRVCPSDDRENNI